MGADVVVQDSRDRAARSQETTASMTGGARPTLPDRAVVPDRDRPGPRLARRPRVGLRAGQRAHRHARIVRGGGAGRRPGDLPQRVLRGAAAAPCRDGLRVPGDGPDGRQRDRRQADPAAGQGLPAGPELRRDHRAPAHARSARWCPAADDGMAVAGRPDGAGHQHPAGLPRPPVHRRHPVPGRGHRRPRRPLRGRAVGSAGQRGRARQRRGRSAGRGGARRAPAVRAGGRPGTACRPGAPDQAQPPARRRRHGPRARDPRHQHRGHRGQRRPGPVLPGGTDPARWSAEADQVHRLRLVLAPVGRRGPRPGGGLAGHGQAGRLGPAGPGAARAARPALGRVRRRDRGRRRAPAGGARGHVPRPAGRAARGAPADPGEGADRPRIRRAHVLGHRDLRAAGAHLHRPAGGA